MIIMPNPAPRKNRPARSILPFFAKANNKSPSKKTIEAVTTQRKSRAGLGRARVPTDEHSTSSAILVRNGRTDPKCRTCRNGVHGKDKLKNVSNLDRMCQWGKEGELTPVEIYTIPRSAVRTSDSKTSLHLDH